MWKQHTTILGGGGGWGGMHINGITVVSVIMLSIVFSGFLTYMNIAFQWRRAACCDLTPYRYICVAAWQKGKGVFKGGGSGGSNPPPPEIFSFFFEK